MRIWIPLALAATSLAAPAMGLQHPGHDSVDATRQEIKAIRAELRALRQEIKGQVQEARGHVLETNRSGNLFLPKSNERVIIQHAQAGAPGQVIFGFGQAGGAPKAAPQTFGFVPGAQGGIQSFAMAPAAPQGDCHCCCHGCDSNASQNAMAPRAPEAPRAPQMVWSTEQRFPQGGAMHVQHGMGPEDGIGKGQLRFEVSLDGDSFFMGNDDAECEGAMDCEEEEEILWDLSDSDLEMFFSGDDHGGGVFEFSGDSDTAFWGSDDEGSFQAEGKNFFWSSDEGDIDVEIEALLKDLKGQQGDHKVMVKRINMPHAAEGSNVDIDVQVQELVNALHSESKDKPKEVKLHKAFKVGAVAPSGDIDAEIEALLAELNGDKGAAPKTQKVHVQKVAAVPAVPAVASTQPAKLTKASQDSDQKRIQELEAEVAELRSMVDALIKELNQQ